jgi:hypothetical protein
LTKKGQLNNQTLNSSDNEQIEDSSKEEWETHSAEDEYTTNQQRDKVQEPSHLLPVLQVTNKPEPLTAEGIDFNKVKTIVLYAQQNELSKSQRNAMITEEGWQALQLIIAAMPKYKKITLDDLKTTSNHDLIVFLESKMQSSKNTSLTAEGVYQEIRKIPNQVFDAGKVQQHIKRLVEIYTKLPANEQKNVDLNIKSTVDKMLKEKAKEHHQFSTLHRFFTEINQTIESTDSRDETRTISQMTNRRNDWRFS